MADQIEILKSLLWNRRSELVLSIRSRSTELDVGEAKGEFELIDVIQGMQRRDEAVSLLTSLRSNLIDVDTALIAIQEGWYGTCNECGEPIPSKRLQAVPWALCCVQCQEVLDQRKQNGRSYEYENVAA